MKNQLEIFYPHGVLKYINVADFRTYQNGTASFTTTADTKMVNPNSTTKLSVHDKVQMIINTQYVFENYTMIPGGELPDDEDGDDETPFSSTPAKV